MYKTKKTENVENTVEMIKTSRFIGNNTEQKKKQRNKNHITFLINPLALLNILGSNYFFIIHSLSFVKQVLVKTIQTMLLLVGIERPNSWWVIHNMAPP